MRIGISGFFLDKPYTGSGQYLTNLLNHLQDIGEHEYLMIEHHRLARGQKGRSDVGWSSASEKRSVAKRDSAKRRPSSLMAEAARRAEIRLPENLAKLLFEQVSVPVSCRAGRMDLCHVPYYAPPLAHRCPVVVTIHDLIMLAMPEHQTSPLVRWYNALAARAATRAEMILADSVATKLDIIRFLNISEERIRVVYLAQNEDMTPVDDDRQLEAIRHKYGLGHHFVFYIGGLDRRKNVDTLIRSSVNLPDGWLLAIAGQVRTDNPQIFPDLQRVAREASVADRVRFIGQVPEDDKRYLYSACELFVFPSLYEGFGLTPLEAMACSAPVLCSNASSLPEVVGDGGLLFAPEDTGHLARLIAEVAGNPDLRADLSQRAVQRAGRFAWSKTAQETQRVYEEARHARRQDRVLARSASD